MSSLRHLLSVIFSFAAISLLFAIPYWVLKSHEKKLDSEIVKLNAEIETMRDRVSELPQKQNQSFRLPAQLILQESDQNSSEIALQDAVIELAQEQNLTLMSFGSAPLSKTTHAESIGFQLEFEAALGDFYEFLARLEQQTPRLAVEAIRIRQNNTFDHSQVSIQGTMKVWTFLSLSGQNE